MKIHPFLKIWVLIISVTYLILYILLTPSRSGQAPDAFVVVNNDVVLTNKNLSQRLKDIYSVFSGVYESNPEMVKPNWEKAKQARICSGDLLKYIEQVKYQLIAKTEHIPLDSAKEMPFSHLKRKNDYKKPTYFFLANTDEGRSGIAIKLKTKIDDYRNKMLDLVDKPEVNNLNTILSTSGPYSDADGEKQNWQRHFFYHTKLAGDITLLNMFESDVYNAEYEVVDYLYRSIGKRNFKFDKLQALVLTKSNYVFLGDDYQANVILAPNDASQSTSVYLLDGVDYLPADMYKEAMKLNSKQGKIMIRFPARKLGINKYAGFVRERTSKGQINDYHFGDTYIVSKPLLTVSATKMNIFYIGVSNPVSIAIWGIPTEDLVPSISCGIIQKNSEGNNWLVDIPPGEKQAIITVYADVDGKRRDLGSKMFRVKTLPTPIATIAGRSSGGIDSNILLAAGAIAFHMPGNFDYDQTFTISSFTMTIQRGYHYDHFQSNNAYLTAEMRDQIQSTNRGQNIIFENIIARDSNGTERKLAPITLTIN